MTRPHVRLVPAVVALATVGLAMALAVGAWVRPGLATGTTPTDLSVFGQRVLVIATHPDDEVLTAGGAITELVARGAKVRVVIATAGDAYAAAAREISPSPRPETFRELAEWRRRESAASAQALGLSPADVVRLGYADGGGAAMWDASWDASHAFTGRNGSAVVPYSWAFRPGAPECGSALTADLVAQIRDFRPDSVISPDTRETNSDHAAVAAFTLLALDQAGFSGTHLSAVVHFKGFPRPTAYLPAELLSPPRQLVEPGVTWLSLPLDASALHAKTAALRTYRSQLNVADRGVYMRAFLRANEIYADRRAALAATAAADSVPATGGTGTVAVTPLPVIPSARPNPVRALSLRVVRGPQRVWFGIVCAGSVTPDASYTLNLRLADAAGTVRRLDVAVEGGRPSTVRVDSASVETTDLAAVAHGDTLWISVPANLVSAHPWALAACGTSLQGYSNSHTPWVDLRF